MVINIKYNGLEKIDQQEYLVALFFGSHSGQAANAYTFLYFLDLPNVFLLRTYYCSLSKLRTGTSAVDTGGLLSSLYAGHGCHINIDVHDHRSYGYF